MYCVGSPSIYYKQAQAFQYFSFSNLLVFPTPFIISTKCYIRAQSARNDVVQHSALGGAIHPAYGPVSDVSIMGKASSENPTNHGHPNHLPSLGKPC